MKIKTSITIDEEILRKLEKESEKEHRSLSNLIEMILIIELSRRPI